MILSSGRLQLVKAVVFKVDGAAPGEVQKIRGWGAVAKFDK